MLHADQDGWPESDDARGSSYGARPRLLADLARDIEDTQRRQSEALSDIVRRMRALERGDAAGAGFRSQSPDADESGDEPWDPAAAEALMQSYEAEQVPPPAIAIGGSAAASNRDSHDWLGFRFNDLTQRIKRTLSDLRPGSTLTLLEERLDQFQRRMASALEDVVRRQDLQGLRLIEEHVSDLGGRLDQLQAQVARLDGIEADVRSVMEQVSDERIASLLDYDARFTADLEAIAMRAAEEVHARLGADSGRDLEDAARRHEELRQLIESSIHERRQYDAEASSLVADLGGAVSAQADRHEEIKSLLETAISDQRRGEQNALGMLETLQQAVVGILDRMDALEAQQQAAPAQPAEAASWKQDLGADRFAGAEAPYAYAAENAPRSAEPDMPRMPASAAYAPAAAYEAPVPPPTPEPEVQDDGLSPVERMRRDFIADARRAKMKAAANRAEAVAQKAESPRQGAPLSAASEIAKSARQQLGSTGRLFGFSPKLLVGALALVVAINGGILLLGRKHGSPPPVVEIKTPSDPALQAPADPAAPAGSSEHEQPQTAPNNAMPGPRSDLDMDQNGMIEDSDAEPVELFTLPADDVPAEPVGLPLGASDDILNPPAVEAREPGQRTKIPRGMTLGGQRMSDVDLADVYQQQILAGLSGQAGMLAAGATADDLLPEKAGRIDSAYTPPETAEPADRAVRSSALDLPPATVGPLSLRLAAANGDASAQFEVGARLAEGNGTPQDLEDALQWYQRSAAQGFAQAQYRLGTLFERGLGVAKDLGRARVWYQRAAEQGNVKSMHNLAVLSAGGDAPDYASAMQWFSKAAEHGLADSQFNLAVLIENGLGVKQDRVTAYKWYALAAKGGDADAVQRRDALKATLSATDLTMAEALVKNFRAKRAIPMVNDARAAGEDWKKRVNNDTNG